MADGAPPTRWYQDACATCDGPAGTPVALRGEWAGILFGAFGLSSYIANVAAILTMLSVTRGNVRALNVVAIGALVVQTVSVGAWFLFYRRCRPWTGFLLSLAVTVLGGLIFRFVVLAMIRDALDATYAAYAAGTTVPPPPPAAP